MKKILLLCAIAFVEAVFFTACEFNFDKRPENTGPGFVPVESIYGATERSQPFVRTLLSGTVMPEDATEKKIDWSIKSDGGTYSELEGNVLTANAEGTVTVTATIKDGLGEGIDFTEHFDIVISLVSPFAVREILGIPSSLPIGDFTAALKGEIVPTNTSYKNIDWSVIDADGTGAYFYGNVLTVNSKVIDPINNIRAAATGGTVTVRATIKDGLLDEGDFIQDFKIAITRGVVAAGSYTNSNVYPKACYWVNGQLFELPLANGANVTQNGTDGYVASNSRATGIVYVGDTQYIAGWYRNANNPSQATVCYWKDGVEGSPLPDATGNYATSQTTITSKSFDIAAGGGFVYILGTLGSTAYYWKINVSNNTATRVTLTNPSTSSNFEFDNFSSNTAYQNIYKNITVKNNGDFFMAKRLWMGSNTYTCYYWDSSNASTVGGVTSISPVSIPALNDVSSIDSVGVVGGVVYVAGSCPISYGFGSSAPYYYRMGDSVYYSVNYSGFKGTNYRSETLSIIEQNGSPVFYGRIRYDLYGNYYPRNSYWDTGGNTIEIHDTNYDLLPERVVFSDGDAYIVMSADFNLQTVAGYMVLREPFPFFRVNSPDADNGGNASYIYGIAVR